MTVMTMYQRYGLVGLVVLAGLLSGCGNSTEETPPATNDTASETVVSDADTAPETASDAAQPQADSAEDVRAEPSTASADTDIDTDTAATATEPSDVAADTADAPLAADAGKTLYEARCKICHEGGMLNAPRLSDKAAWAPRLAKGNETLYQHSINGFNKMPAQASDGVSEAEVKAAVDYMVAAVS